MQNATVSSPNDFKVVSFTNKTDFDFTPEMGCMYDSRPISGISGSLGIKAGESMTLPYHIGHRLATNLAKVAQIRKAPIVDEANNPVGKPLWNEEALESIKNSFLTELYSEQKPVQQTETDRLFALVEQYKTLSETLLKNSGSPVQDSAVEAPVVDTKGDTAKIVFADKQDVMTELDKRRVKYDKRASKANLEKLLV